MVKIIIKIIGVFLLGIGGIGLVLKYYFLVKSVQPNFIFFALTEFSTDAIGFAITILVLDALDSLQADREVKKARKENAIRGLGSTNLDISREALRILRGEGWLKDGSLRYANLREANLIGADLSNADLSFADLSYAKLQNAILVGANLYLADLSLANLDGAVTRNSNIDKAIGYTKKDDAG